MIQEPAPYAQARIIGMRTATDVSASTATVRFGSVGEPLAHTRAALIGAATATERPRSMKP